MSDGFVHAVIATIIGAVLSEIAWRLARRALHRRRLRKCDLVVVIRVGTPFTEEYTIEKGLPLHTAAGEVFVTTHAATFYPGMTEVSIPARRHIQSWEN